MSLLCIGTFIALAAGQGSPNPQITDVTNGFVVHDDRAVALLPPVAVCQGQVEQASWSPDGRYLVILRDDLGLTPNVLNELSTGTDPKSVQARQTESVGVWDEQRQTFRAVWRPESGQTQDFQCTWFAGTDQALISAVEPGRTQNDPRVRELLDLNAQTGTAGTISRVPDEGRYMIEPSPSKPEMVIYPQAAYMGREKPVELTLLRADGTWQKLPQAPKPFDTRGFPTWNTDGTRFILTHYERGKEKGKTVYSCAAYDEQSGTWAEDDSLQAFSLPDPTPQLYVVTMHLPKEIEQAGVPASIWLTYGIDPDTTWADAPSQAPEQPKSDAPAIKPALVAAEGDLGLVSPKQDAVFYSTRGVGLIRPLLDLPKSAYDAELKAKQIADALNQAKACGLAALMYASDNDDKYPGKNDNLKDILTPYLKNSDLLSNFVYTFRGGTADDIQSPADTELGYVTGPDGGRAVVYADGHASWHGAGN